MNQNIREENKVVAHTIASKISEIVDSQPKNDGGWVSYGTNLLRLGMSDNFVTYEMCLQAKLSNKKQEAVLADDSEYYFLQFEKSNEDLVLWEAGHLTKPSSRTVILNDLDMSEFFDGTESIYDLGYYGDLEKFNSGIGAKLLSDMLSKI